MQVRNRIKKLAQLDPSQIVPNPKNWRTHPHAQREVLGGLFADIGIVNACIVRPVGDDKFMLIDGHLRTEVLADQKIPCIILDVNEQEADKILLSLDPLSAMAELDPTKLNDLLASVDMSGESLASLSENLRWQAENFKIEEGSVDAPAGDENKTGDERVPEFFEISVVCESEENQKEIYERLTSEGLKCRVLTY